MRIRKSWIVVLALAFGMGAVSSRAQAPGGEKSEKDKMLDKAKEKAKEEIEKKIGGEKPGTPAQPSEEEMQKMMEEMAKLAAPGPEHDYFKPLVGKWNVKSSWTMPGAPAPSTSTGTAEYKLILGGRFIVEDLHLIGVEDKQPFDGYGVSGFDKAKGKYIGTWMDSMGTAISTSEGTLDPSGRIMTSTMNVQDCMTKEMKNIKMVEETVSEDQRVMKMYENQDGKEVVTLEVTYTRAK